MNHFVSICKIWLAELLICFGIGGFVSESIRAQGWGHCKGSGTYPNLFAYVSLVAGIWLWYWLLNRITHSGSLYARLFEPPLMGMTGVVGFRKMSAQNSQFGHSIRPPDGDEYYTRQPAYVLIEGFNLALILTHFFWLQHIGSACAQISNLTFTLVGSLLLTGLGGYRLLLSLRR